MRVKTGVIHVNLSIKNIILTVPILLLCIIRFITRFLFFSIDRTIFNCAFTDFRAALSFFILVAFGASCHEAWRNYSEHPVDAEREILVVRIFHSFSIITNGNYLLSTKAPSRDLACLNGLRKLQTSLNKNL